jgi:hypothetical protein
MGTAQGAGVGKEAIRENVEDQALKAGMLPEEAAALGQRAQQYNVNPGLIGMNAAAGALAAGTGAQPIIAGMLRKGGREATEQATRGMMASIGRGAVTEALPEGLQGGVEQLGGNIASQREGFEVPTMRGVYGNAALEAAVSAPIGGVAGGVDAYTRPAPPAGPMTRALQAGGTPVATPAAPQSARPGLSATRWATVSPGCRPRPPTRSTR